MKIIISPAKTKLKSAFIYPPSTKNQGFAPEITSKIIIQINKLSLEEFAKIMKLTPEKAASWKQFYQNYNNEPTAIAIEAYDGLVFKNLAWNTLSEGAKDFGNKYLRIISGLYGIVQPQDFITDYRLDLENNVFKNSKSIANLYSLWSKACNEVFDAEDWILNLASKEYSKLIEHPQMITVDFLQWKNGTWKSPSTAVKIMRGQLLHYIIENQITKLGDLPREINGYILESDIPTDNIIQYKAI